jgi:hypothetical protein
MSIKELTDEELLALAGKSVVIKEKTTINLTEAQRFVNHFKIVEGKDKLDTDVLYQLYFDWRKTVTNKRNGTKMLTRNQFTHDFSKFFKMTRYNDKGIRKQHYYLNRLCFNIFSDKEMDELFWKSRRKLNKDKANRERQKKKQNQTI